MVVGKPNPLRRELELRRRMFASSPAWEPQPTNEPQKAAFECTADEIGYGGAKGGGKSQLGTGLAMMRHHYTNCFRKNYEEHSAMLEIIRVDFPPGLKDNPPVYRTPTPRKRKLKARTIRFCHLERGDKDLRKYQGKRVDLLWIDEAVHFTRHQVEMLAADIGKLRPQEADADGIKPQMLLTFNPPLDMVGLWVIDFFAPWVDENHPMYPQPYGKILYCCKIDEKDYFFESPEPLTHHPVTGAAFDKPLELKSRTFFKANLFDNEAYRDDKAFLARLQSMGEVERRALLDGEMSASLVDQAGQICRRKPWEIAEKRWPEKHEIWKHIPPIVVSIDVAKGGGDMFVCMPFWKKGHAGNPHATEGKNVSLIDQQVKFVEDYLGEIHTTPLLTALIVDNQGGFGAGFIEAWRKKYPEAHVVEFMGGASAGINNIFGGSMETPKIGEISGMPLMSGSVAFDNKIGAAWFRAGEMLEHPLFEISVPRHLRLKKEALTRVVKERSGARVSIESKDDLSKRLTHSPDFADAWVMGLWYLSVELAVREMF